MLDKDYNNSLKYFLDEPGKTPGFYFIYPLKINMLIKRFFRYIVQNNTLKINDSMSYLEKAKNLYTMIGQGQMMDAFEKYYHDKVVMEELGEEPRRGKEVNREYEMKFLAMIKEMHGAGVDSITSNEDEKVTMVENWMDVSFMDGNRVRLEQVAVQRWDGDQIAYEKFYHK